MAVSPEMDARVRQKEMRGLKYPVKSVQTLSLSGKSPYGYVCK